MSKESTVMNNEELKKVPMLLRGLPRKKKSLGDKIQGIIDGIINLKGNEALESMQENMKREDMVKYNTINGESSAILNELEVSLSAEQYELLVQYMDKEAEAETIIQDYMYRSGVISGWKELNFIKKELDGIIIY